MKETQKIIFYSAPTPKGAATLDSCRPAGQHPGPACDAKDPARFPIHRDRQNILTHPRHRLPEMGGIRREVGRD